MQIATRVWLSVTVSIAVSVLLGAYAFSLHREMGTGLAQSERYQEVIKKTFALNALLADLSGEFAERSTEQARAVSASLRGLLAEIPADVREEALRAAIERDSKEIPALLEQLVQARSRQPRYALLVRQLAIKVRAVTDTTHRLLDATQAAIAGQQRKSEAAFLALIGLLVLANTGIFLASNASILRGIRQLTQGARHFAAADFTYRVPVSGPSEVAELAGTFNAMAADLGEHTVALEARVKERTATLEVALADKDTLLREVHHRVKNNLQMLCDLMYLQMEAMPDRDQHPDLQDAYGRVYAIARLHEQLYQSMHSGRIQLDEYLRRLAGGFENLFSAVAVKVDAMADGVALDLDRSIHVGLIVNELVTNSIKHAYPKDQPGEVAVTLRALGDQVQLQVRDTGRGLPPALDLTQAKSVGLRTVHLLARRLEAQVMVTRNGGTAFTLTIPVHADPPVEPKLGQS